MGENWMNLNLPAIINSRTGKPFKGPEKITLPNNRSAISFHSESLIPLSQSETDRLQLVEDFDSAGKFNIILSALPLPDFRIISSAARDGPGKDENSYSRIFIY